MKKSQEKKKMQKDSRFPISVKKSNVECSGWFVQSVTEGWGAAGGGEG